jgi:hypothetical protein
MMKVQADQASANEQKMLKKYKNSSMKTISEQSMCSQTLFGTIMEFARRS